MLGYKDPGFRSLEGLASTVWERKWQKRLQEAAWPYLGIVKLWSLLSLLHGYARVEVSTQRVQSSCVATD